MPIFSQGDVVKVPFPYTNRPTRQFRPALVISNGDVALDELSGTGLPAPSVIRTAKIATIEARDAARLGRIGEGVRAEVLTHLRQYLGLGAGG